MSSMIIESIIFLSYMLICAALTKRRFSLRTTIIAFGIAFAVISGVQAAFVINGEKMLALTILPITAYLPFSVLLYFLSDCGVFETAAVCSVGMLDMLILKSLDKVLVKCLANSEMPGSVQFGLMPGIICAMAFGLVFIAFRFIRKNFQLCVIENRNNQLLLSLPVVLIFLLIFYFLNSTTDVLILIFTICIAVLIYLIIAKLLISTAELIEVKHSEKEMLDYMDIQKRAYDKLMRKLESGRVYRHDMRHHLTMIEGLAKQRNSDKIVEYTSKLVGSLSEFENVVYCKSPELNAVLSEYISRAKNVGCKVSHTVMLPDTLPFDEDDICMVVANSVENAINACAKLPEQQRSIDIALKCVDGCRLFITVRNPFCGSIDFDKNGLPISKKRSEDHGIGLRSAKHIAEKYNGFLRCKQEDGEFVFNAALFWEEDAVEATIQSGKSNGMFGRAAASLAGAGVVITVALNILPTATDAASSLLSADMHTARIVRLSWGDSSISIDSPGFSGNGAGELNSAVKSYTDEAKEKFLWYFNRRYNGYVAEDMRYTVIRDDEKYFIAQFNVTINAGGSIDYSRWIVFDKSEEKVLELADMFDDGSDYIKILSDEILKQMRYKNKNEDGSFFIPGEVSDEECFTQISEDANFYIDSSDRLVIVFDEYEVAPGYMGCPEFIIPDNLLENSRGDDA